MPSSCVGCGHFSNKTVQMRHGPPNMETAFSILSGQSPSLAIYMLTYNTGLMVVVIRSQVTLEARERKNLVRFIKTKSLQRTFSLICKCKKVAKVSQPGHDANGKRPKREDENSTLSPKFK